MIGILPSFSVALDRFRDQNGWSLASFSSCKQWVTFLCDVLSWAPIFPKSPITELMMDFDPRLAMALTESANIFLS